MSKLVSQKANFLSYIEGLQNQICNALEGVDGKARFIEDKWKRSEGGGGTTRVISNGSVIEKGGVNISAVCGKLPEILKSNLGIDHGDFFACGLSLVLHPLSPMAPTVHANYRYFELYEKDNLADLWFGGGADLTPYYLWEEDAVHFHNTMKKACEQADTSYYRQFKQQCDEYFFNKHRNEARGIGGIFFDYLRPTEQKDESHWYDFVTSAGNHFLPAYLPILEKRTHEPYDDEHRYWQEIRRGRYVEFNLIHDRGTLFGLKTNGRIESILMSLPPRVRWDYDYQPKDGSREKQLLEGLEPRDWVN